MPLEKTEWTTLLSKMMLEEDVAIALLKQFILAKNV